MVDDFREFKCNNCGQDFSHTIGTSCPFCHSTDIKEKHPWFGKKSSNDVGVPNGPKEDIEPTSEVEKPQKEPWRFPSLPGHHIVSGVIALGIMVVMFPIAYSVLTVLTQVNHQILTSPTVNSTLTPQQQQNLQNVFTTAYGSFSLVATVLPIVLIAALILAAFFMFLGGGSREEF